MLEIENIKRVVRMVTPWKRSRPLSEYDKGWNDAIKEVKRNYRKYILPVLEKEEKKLDEN